MPLPQPKKGTAPATGKVKPSRAEQLMSATRALAAEQLPEEHTMTAIDGVTTQQPAPSGPAAGAAAPALPRPESAAAPEQASYPRRPTAAPSDDQGVEIRSMPVDAIRRSPFQPRGRPSEAAITAVREAIGGAGSLGALMGPDGSQALGRLDGEATRLAELAFDVSTNGVETPLEVRTAEDGHIECLAGHRRLAAAKLAGLDTVPVLHRGAMTSAAAAATVLRGNLHREDFTSWQEAVLVSEVQERRRGDGYRDNVRTLGTVMGWSHGKVNALLRIRRALSPGFLATVGDGDAARVEEALARAPYRDLERLAAEPDAERRASATRRMLGWSGAPAASPRDRSVVAHRPKRGGGFLIEVHEPVESLTAGDAALLREILESQLVRLRARLETVVGRSREKEPRQT